MLVEQPLADHFRGFASVVERDGGTTYPAICRAVADDDQVLSLLDGAPLPQRRPLLLLAAVHYLLLSGVEHRLATHYDTVADVRGTLFDPAGDAAADFTDFCQEHRTALEKLVATRSTQTNEVGRCTALLPALCHIAEKYGWSEPLSLLDLGTSAGLNLLFDDYAYTYRAAAGDETLVAGAAGAAVAFECSARGDLAHLPQLRLPLITGARRPRPRTGRPVLRRCRPVAPGLPVARQPAALRAPPCRAGQRAHLRALPAARTRRHGDRFAADRRHHPR